MTQKQLAFMILFENKGKWLMPFEFIGEITINGKSYFGSYKMPARLSDLMDDLSPEIIERKKVKGKSGAEYYAYRFHQKIPLLFLPEYYRELIF